MHCSVNREFVSHHVVQRFTVDDDLSGNKRREREAPGCEALDEESGAEMKRSERQLVAGAWLLRCRWVIGAEGVARNAPHTVGFAAIND